MKTVYLAGPIDGVEFDATYWRVEAGEMLKDFGIEALDPLREKWGSSIEAILTTPKAIISRDLNDIARCDAVICNLRYGSVRSVGTLVEIGYAYALRKPIILIPGPLYNNPFVNETCSFIVGSIEDACMVASSVLAS